MKWIVMLALALTTCLSSADSGADDFQRRQQQITGEARQGFEQLLELWRQERFDELYDHLVPTGSGRWNFLDQLNHSARLPACCWEQIADLTVVYLNDTSVLLTAKLGIEVEGVGTHFVTRTFRLVKEAGVWRLPESDILSLAEPNMQRIPRKILPMPY